MKKSEGCGDHSPILIAVVFTGPHRDSPIQDLQPVGVRRINLGSEEHGTSTSRAMPAIKDAAEPFSPRIS